MPKYALEDTNYELIKAHILDPENSPLSNEQKKMLDRVSSVAKVLDKNPIQKNAVAIHMAKYPDIGRTRAHLDVKLAMKLFNTIHTFDFDFWQTWLINDIVENIRRARNGIASASNDKQVGALQRVIAMEHSNLIKAIGDKPTSVDDPKLTEKHNFLFVIQNNNTYQKIDVEKLRGLDESSMQEFIKAVFAGNQITDVEAEQMIKS